MKLPPGVRDWLPAELERKRAVESAIRGVCERRGYREVQTPGFERADVLEAGLGDTLAEKTFRFHDRRGDLIALRSEMTTPIARLVSTRLRGSSLPLRLSYVAPGYRYEEPQEGRMCEFTQAGCELIGAQGFDADAEALFMAFEVFDAVGLRDARFDVNHAAIIDGVLDGLGLNAVAARTAKHLIAARNVVELKAFVAQHAQGAGDLNILVELALLRGDARVLDVARRVCRTPASLEGIARLADLLRRAGELGYGERIAIDFALLRDFEYYTGLVFEGYVGEVGLSLCGGGRYDRLLPRFGFDAPAVGWMAGVERLLIALERRKTHDKLVIAVPKGALYADARARLASAGIVVPEDTGRMLTVDSADGSARILLLRPTDVPAYVEFGAADCGIVGKDVLWETDRSVSELADLGFGPCRLVVAAQRAAGYHEGAALPTFLRVATKFVRCAESYFAERDLPVQIIPLHGSVELSPIVGLADLIVDLVATGKTLRDHDMVIVDEIAPSTARFVVNPIRFRVKYDAITALLERLVSA